MSKVSDDREFMRNNIKHIINKETDVITKMKNKTLDCNFSYLDAFLKYVPRECKGDTKRKIKNLSTINILYSMYLSFKRIDKKFIKSIETIKQELSSRNDIFESALEFFENEEIVYDDLYFWHPDIRYNDVFSVLIAVLPNLVEIYKKYIVEFYIVGNTPKMRLLEIFKNRLDMSFVNFDVIKKDLHLFDDRIDDTFEIEYEEVSNVGVKRKETSNGNNYKRLQKENIKGWNVKEKIISGLHWQDEDIHTEDCGELSSIIGNVERRKKYNECVDLILMPNLSYIDITINNKHICCTFTQMNDLLTKNDRAKQFWIDKHIVNENWECL